MNQHTKAKQIEEYARSQGAVDVTCKFYGNYYRMEYTSNNGEHHLTILYPRDHRVFYKHWTQYQWEYDLPATLRNWDYYSQTHKTPQLYMEQLIRTYARKEKN